MICHNVFKEYPQYHNTIRNLLTGGLQNYRCLIMLDGLDEKKGKLDFDIDITRCIFIITSRHWKFYECNFHINAQDKVVEVFGLDTNGAKQVIKKTLINYFEMDETSAAFKNTEMEMLRRCKNNKFKSLLNIPLLLTVSIHLWQSNVSSDGSLTSFFVGLVGLIIKIAFNEGKITDHRVLKDTVQNTDIPVIIRKHKMLKEHFEVLLALGKLAFKDLVLGNLQSTDRNEDLAQVVFEMEELELELGKDVLKFALDVGLLSEFAAPGSLDEENVSISFFHKTVEEFMAALYMAYSHEARSNLYASFCALKLEESMEFSNILTFLIGLEPNIGKETSEMVLRKIKEDTDILRSMYNDIVYSQAELATQAFVMN